MYQPCLGGWDIDKLLPDRIELKLELTVASYGQSVFVPIKAADINWQFQIQQIDLVLHHVRLNNKVLEQNSLAMIERPWLANTFVKIYQKQVQAVGIGANSINLANVYQGSKPKFVLVGIQDNNELGNTVTNYDYDADANPLIMDQCNGVGTDFGATYVDDIYILVNGKQYPSPRPYNIATSSSISRVREYRAYEQIAKTSFPNSEEPLISYAQYISNYMWFVFLIDPSESDDVWSLTEDVNIEVHAHLTNVQAGVTNAAVHTIAYVPAVLQIDGARVCELKTKSGAVLRLDESVSY